MYHLRMHPGYDANEALEESTIGQAIMVFTINQMGCVHHMCLGHLAAGP